MIGKELFAAFFGLAAGGVTAAGIFAFLVAIGLVQRLADKTHTASRMRTYETCFILGSVWGNLVWLYGLPIFGGVAVQAVLGLSYGIFVGCLIMSLAETLNVIPVFLRRLHIRHGLPWILVCFAAGKMVGSFLFFWRDLG